MLQCKDIYVHTDNVIMHVNDISKYLPCSKWGGYYYFAILGTGAGVWHAKGSLCGCRTEVKFCRRRLKFKQVCLCRQPGGGSRSPHANTSRDISPRIKYIGQRQKTRSSHATNSLDRRNPESPSLDARRPARRVAWCEIYLKRAGLSRVGEW